MKPATLATVTFLALLSSELIDAAVHMQAGTTRKPGSLALCEREGQEIVGEKPRRRGTRTGRPKKLRNVVPDYPERPQGTTVRVGGAWVGEVLIDANGGVSGFSCVGRRFIARLTVRFVRRSSVVLLHS